MLQLIHNMKMYNIHYRLYMFELKKNRDNVPMSLNYSKTVRNGLSLGVKSFYQNIKCSTLT